MVNSIIFVQLVCVKKDFIIFEVWPMFVFLNVISVLEGTLLDLIVEHQFVFIYTLMMVILRSVISRYMTYAIYFSLKSLLYVEHFLLQFYLLSFLYTGDHIAAAYSRFGYLDRIFPYQVK